MAARWGRVVFVLVVFVVLLLGGPMSCAVADCAATGTCVDPMMGGTDGGTVYPEVPPPPGCDPAADPKDATACVDDVYALFVDPRGGSSSGDGSKAAPLQTLEAATNIDALAGRPRIYVCNALELAESVRLPPNVSLIGGFDCATWHYAGAPTRIAPGPASLALRVDASPKGFVVSDVALVTNDTAGDGASNVAVLVANSKATFRRVTVEAGIGTSGITQATPSNEPSDPLDGNSTLNGAPADAKTCTCAKRGASSGGKGGALNGDGTAGSVEPVVAGVGGTPGTGGAPCSTGGPGGNGATGGASGKRSGVLGTLTAEGWTPGRGGDGGIGDPGAGGGGGGGTQQFAGGGGACGGCGGHGGIGGAGGGASIALALLMSDVTLVGGSYTSAQAGDGARGGPGDNGRLGGRGGSGVCSGGAGGNGAGGGGGAGGAGGVSAAVVRVGGSIQMDDATKLLSGKSGAHGSGGYAGVGDQPGGAGDDGLELVDASSVLVL